MAVNNLLTDLLHSFAANLHLNKELVSANIR